jgi:tetratricopeptide (TPR) repeat protein
MSSLDQAGPARSRHLGWPVLSGMFPPLADSSAARPETGISPAALPPGQTTVLVPGGELTRGMGGTGKTQLAATLAGQHAEGRLADLIVWVSGATEDAVIGGYAQALRDVGVPDQGEGTEQAAAQFLTWLETTTRPWLVVLDDVRDAAALEGRWPRGPAGRVVVTTEQPTVADGAPQLHVVNVGAFSPREALAYLSGMLRADPDQRVGALDLASDVGFRPVTLGQAAAYLTETRMDCREYRSLWAERRRHPAFMAGGAAFAGMAAAWSLGAELADGLPPAGLAHRALALISMLAPGGIPGAVLTCPASCAFLTAPGAAPVDEVQARAAVHNLARAGLVTVDPRSAARTVLAHPTVQAFARQSLTPAEAAAAATAAAAALADVWANHDVPPAAALALRDCTARLREVAGGLLWRPDCHPVMLHAGRSLDRDGLWGPAVAYWQDLLTASEQALGAEHAQTVAIRDSLGNAYQASGRVSDAIGLYEATVSEREQALGGGHPETVAARQRLAGAYLTGDHTDAAVHVAEQALADCERSAGPSHRDTLAARENLAQCYLNAGRMTEAITAYQRAAAAWEEAAGPRDAGTIAARAGLASAYLKAGQFRDAITIGKRVLTDREQVQGADHPDTMAARSSLAAAYQSANKRKDALRLYERTLADAERIRGPDHPDTIMARTGVATANLALRKYAVAVAQYERALADAERAYGPTHPLTQTAREDLDTAARHAQAALGIDLRSPARQRKP